MGARLTRILLALLPLLFLASLPGCDGDGEDPAGGFLVLTQLSNMKCRVLGADRYEPEVHFHVENIAGDKAQDPKVNFTFYYTALDHPDLYDNAACSTTIDIGDLDPNEAMQGFAFCTCSNGCPASYSYYFTNVSGTSGSQ